MDQALYSDLERAYSHLKTNNSTTCNLITTAYPGQIKNAYEPMIFKRLNLIYDARTQALIALPTAASKAHASSPYDPTKDPLLQKADAQLASLQAAITDASASSGVPNVILGGALLWALGDRGGADQANSYHVLTVSDDAAGGGTRANIFFFINLFIPAAHPSYNGGAVASYTLRDQNGLFEDAQTLRFVFGYGKWKEPPLRNQDNKGFANFGWTNNRNRGHWTPIY